MNSPLVFLVDHNPIHLSLIKYHLNIHHIFNILSFPNGQECLYRISKGNIPDYIITDYDAGNYTGFDFLERVRSLKDGVKVIFFSSYDDPVLAFRLLEAGASDYIAKTGHLETGIHEVIKNVKFMVKARNLG